MSGLEDGAWVIDAWHGSYAGAPADGRAWAPAKTPGLSRLWPDPADPDGKEPDDVMAAIAETRTNRPRMIGSCVLFASSLP